MPDFDPDSAVAVAPEFDAASATATAGPHEFDEASATPVERPQPTASTTQRQPLDIGDQLKSAYDFKIDPSELLKPFPAAKAIIDAIIPDAPQTEAMRLTGVAHKPSAAERISMKAKGALETVASPGGVVLGAAGALAPEVVGPIMAATAVPQVVENVKEIARGDVAGGVAGLAINAPMLAGAAAPFMREAAPATASAVERGGAVLEEATKVTHETAAASETAVTTPAPVTLYRATSPTENFNTVFKSDSLDKFSHPEKPGEFWTSDPAYADYFRESYGKDATVETRQIPASEAEQYRVSPNEFKLPPASRDETTTSTTPATEPGPGLVGMGGALEGEVASGGTEDLFGISQKARDAMAETGRFPYTPPGQGTSAWEEIQRGRALIREGADPAATLAGFESTQRLSSADVAVTRAHMEQLYQEARRIEVAKGTNSPEYRTKQAEMADWWKRTKPMGTEWHKIGVGQQGLTDIDTGSLVGMEKAHFDATGERFTPEQTQVAGEHAATVNETRGQAEAAQQQVLASIEREKAARAPKGAKAPPPPLTSAEARAQLGEIKGKATPQQAQTIWQHAKRAYIEKGEANLDAIAQGAATDLGLPRRTVMEAIAGSKGTRRLTDEMYLKMARARQAQMAARQWLLNEQSPGWSKWGQRLQRFLFSDKTFGHGTVGAVTHAGPLMFDPRVADIYWRDFGKQFALAYKEGYHEAAMQGLIHSDNFILAKRAGLQNDPFRFSDDYQSQQSQTRFGRFISAGNRGFDALKIMRQDLFDRAWSTLPSDLRTPEAASLIADRFNHATGAMTSRIPPKLGKALALAAFAPKLEGSRWAFAIGDPAKAVLDWRSVSPEKRMAARAEVAQKATMVGTYLAALAANQAYLSATGSDQEINFTDPHRGDFLSFKGGGHEVGIVHPFTRMIGFLADLVRISAGTRGKLERLDTRRNELGERSWQYLQGKASPLAQPILDVVSQSDFQGRPMPFSSDKTPRNVRRQGEGPYTTSEYLTRTLAPIPLEEVVKEAWKSQGMEETKAEAILKALVFSTLPGATGARVKEDTRK